MIDFSQNAVFNLKKVETGEMNRNVSAILLDGETVIGVYKTVRDQVVFTDKRIITVDVKGLTGKRQELFSLPYSKVQYFGIQTVGFAELLPDAELALFFNNGMKANFEFSDKCDITEIGRQIGHFVLE